jgi:hypothetical protein
MRKCSKTGSWIDTWGSHGKVADERVGVLDQIFDFVMPPPSSVHHRRVSSSRVCRPSVGTYRCIIDLDFFNSIQ